MFLEREQFTLNRGDTLPQAEGLDEIKGNTRRKASLPPPAQAGSGQLFPPTTAIEMSCPNTWEQRTTGGALQTVSQDRSLLPSAIAGILVLAMR